MKLFAAFIWFYLRILPTNVPMILIAGDKFAISATNSSGVLRPLPEHFGHPVLCLGDVAVR